MRSTAGGWRATLLATALIVIGAVACERPPSEVEDGPPSTSNPSQLPGFRADAWFLPDDELLGFVEIPAGQFVMGSDAAIDALAFANERWGDGSAQGDGGSSGLLYWPLRSHRGAVRRLRTSNGVHGRGPCLAGSSRSSCDLDLMAGRGRLRSLARERSRTVGSNTAATQPCARRRLAHRATDRSGVGKGSAGTGWADLSVGKTGQRRSGPTTPASRRHRWAASAARNAPSVCST